MPPILSIVFGTLTPTSVVPFRIIIKLYKYSVVSHGQVNSTLYMIKGYYITISTIDDVPFVLIASKKNTTHLQ